jgi:beta-glucosidase
MVVAAAACSSAQIKPPAPTPSTAASASNPSTFTTDARETRFVDSLLSTLTLEDELGQLTMSPAEGLQTGPRRPAGNLAQVRAGQVGSVIGIWGADRTHALQRIAVEESPHRIPILFSLDVIHGFRTVFPVPLAEGASFDPALARSDARIAATEVAANGITWTFAPMVDIARNVRAVPRPPGGMFWLRWKRLVGS